MATKKRLPFLETPKGKDLVVVGNKDNGTLEIPRYYDLTPAERIFIKAELSKIPSFQAEVVKFSEDIAKEEGMGIFDVYNGLTNGNMDVLQKHLGVFIKLREIQQETTPIERQVYATAILKFRIDKDWTLEDTGDPEQVPPVLVRDIYDFAKKEQEGWEDPVPVTEEDIKKLPAGNTEKS